MSICTYLEFEKLGHVVQHGLQGNIVNNIKNESTKANDPSHNYFVEVALLHKKLQCCQRYHKT